MKCKISFEGDIENEEHYLRNVMDAQKFDALLTDVAYKIRGRLKWETIGISEETFLKHLDQMIAEGRD